MWILQTADDQDGEPLTFRLASPGHKTMGRAATADFVVDAALVSRYHCRVSMLPEGGLSVEDLGSTNGTFVNDARVDRKELREGDRLRVGRVCLVVSSTGTTVAASRSPDRGRD